MNALMAMMKETARVRRDGAVAIARAKSNQQPKPDVPESGATTAVTQLSTSSAHITQIHLVGTCRQRTMTQVRATMRSAFLRNTRVARKSRCSQLGAMRPSYAARVTDPGDRCDNCSNRLAAKDEE